MRFLADENVQLPSVEALSSPGHDVVCVARGNPGLADPRLLDQARCEGRILTFVGFFTILGRAHMRQPRSRPYRTNHVVGSC